MHSEKVVLRKFFRLVTPIDDVTVTSPKTRKSLIFLQIMINIFILCQIYIYAQVLHTIKHAFCIIKNKHFTAILDQVVANEMLTINRKVILDNLMQKEIEFIITA